MDTTRCLGAVKDLISAENARDRAAADKLLSERFRGITRSTGAEQSRSAYLDAVENPTNAVHRDFVEGEAISGPSADIVVIRSIVAVREDGAPAKGATRFRNIHVIEEERGTYRCLLWQVTRLVAV